MIRAVQKRTRDVVAASYAVPDLPAAVREGAWLFVMFLEGEHAFWPRLM